MSLHGVDILAFRTNNNDISEVIYVESKVRTSGVSGVLCECSNQLDEFNNSYFNQTLNFYGNILQMTNDSLYNSFSNYVGNRSDLRNLDSFKISLTTEDSINLTKELKNLIDYEPNLPKLHVINISIENLADLIDRVYQSMNIRVEDDDGE